MYQTWGKRCTYIRFLTTKEDEELPTFVSDTKEAYMEIWGKTKEGFRRTYAEFSEEVDWVLKADDDTYVVLENLRYLLSAHNASEPVWFGCEFDVIVKDGGYMSGGAGYVLSRGRRSKLSFSFKIKEHIILSIYRYLLDFNSQF